MNPHPRDVAVPNDWDRRGLPGWAYHSPALLELEKEHVFRNHWQISGHVSDVPNAGDYLTMDVVGERALIVRGKDGVVRAFHNICRHRGSRVVADNQGTCKNALVCPFHGWVYNLDGTLQGRCPPALLPRSRQDRIRPRAARTRDLHGHSSSSASAVGRSPPWPN